MEGDNMRCCPPGNYSFPEGSMIKERYRRIRMKIKRRKGKRV
jgi:hypothetical protein